MFQADRVVVCNNFASDLSLYMRFDNRISEGYYFGMAHEPIPDGWGNDYFIRPEIIEQVEMMTKAAVDFPFSDQWLDDPQGMSKLIRHCKQKLRATRELRGPGLNAMNHLEKIFIYLEKGMPNSIPFRQAVESALGPQAMPTSPRTVFVMWKKIKVAYLLPSSIERKTSPWLRLAPNSTNAWQMLHHLMRAEPLEKYLLESDKP